MSDKSIPKDPRIPCEPGSQHAKRQEEIQEGFMGPEKAKHPVRLRIISGAIGTAALTLNHHLPKCTERARAMEALSEAFSIACELLGEDPSDPFLRE